MSPDGEPAWISLGSNLGDREAAIGAALDRIRALPATDVTAVSGLYRTAPWGNPDQGEFLNAAAAIRTRLAPHALLDACQAIEASLGRTRGERRWGPRVIDLDVVAYADRRIADDRLTLPHPFWRERAFVLVPLAEIAPDLAIDGCRVREALAAADCSGVRPVGAT